METLLFVQPPVQANSKENISVSLRKESTDDQWPVIHDIIMRQRDKAVHLNINMPP